MFNFFSKQKKQKVHFLHIGKTGGSAIKAVLNDFLELPKYQIKLHGHGISLRDIPKNESVIFFLRDPVSRFVSGFYSRQRKGQPRYYSEWSPEEKEVFEKYSTPNEVAVALARQDVSAIMALKNVQHFRCYDKWYGDLDYFQSRIDDILFVGFQESLDEDFFKLKSILDIPEEIRLPTDDIAAHKNPKNVDKFIEPNGITALNEWYAEDAKFIRLCKELMVTSKNHCDSEKS